MKKSSLGRRSGVVKRSVGGERLSQIPIRNPSDRNSQLHRSTLDGLTKPFSGTGVERPSRATSLGRSAGSSYGNTKSTKDNRPLQSKEWQIGAIQSVEHVLSKTVGGMDILSDSGLKPLSLAKFISASECLLKALDSSVIINKHNYMTDLPFLLKRMNYKGKIERSWLIAVNTTHAFPYALGLLHFLAQLVSLLDRDPTDILYPASFDRLDPNDESDELWDWKMMVRHINQCYPLFSNGDPNYEGIKLGLNQQFISDIVEQDSLLKNYELMEPMKQKLQQECQKLYEENEYLQRCYEASSKEIAAGEDIEKNIERLKELIEHKTNHVENLKGDVKNLLNEKGLKAEHKERLLAKSLEVVDMNTAKEFKERRDSIQRDIDCGKQYLSEFEDQLHEVDKEICILKKKFNKISMDHNIKISRFTSTFPELEKFIVPSKYRQLLDTKYDCDEISAILQKFDENFKKLETEKSKLTQTVHEEHDKLKKTLKLVEEGSEKLTSMKSSCEELLSQMKKDKETHERDMKLLKENLAELEEEIKQYSSLRDSLIVVTEEKKEDLHVYESRAKDVLQKSFNIVGNAQERIKVLIDDLHETN